MLKIKNYVQPSWRRWLAIFVLIGVISQGFAGQALAQAVVKGYNADKVLEKGTMVALASGSNTKVEPVSADTINHMFGVVTDPQKTSITLAAPNEQVYVATTGRFNVLISDQNGPVHVNDYISISSLAGVGMHSQIGQPLVFGRAVSSFDGKTNVIRSESATVDDVKKTVAIGMVSVDINIIRNPQAITKNNLPNFLQRVSVAIAGKSVSPTRVYLSCAILVICAIISGSLLYGGVRSSITAIGRNPLSKRSIIFGLAQVTFISLTIFTGGVFAVYLLLKL